MNPARPCQCDRFSPGRPYVYSRDCAKCWMFAHRPEVRAAWGGDPAECIPLLPPTQTRVQPLPCLHEGEIVARCPSCGGNEAAGADRHRRECRHPTGYGICTRSYVSAEVRACDECEDYNPVADRLPDPANCHSCPDRLVRAAGVLCARDIFDIDPARSPGEPEAVRRLSLRLAGRTPPCERWGRKSHIPARPAGSWISTVEAARDTVELAGRLPQDLDIVVGIARAGMFPATIIAEFTGAALYSLCGTTGTITHCGHGGHTQLAAEPRRVLVVDDTCYAGQAMTHAVPHIRKKWPTAIVETAAVYSTPATVSILTHTAAIAPGMTVEWNLLNNPGLLPFLGIDWDGILNRDCYPGEDDDGPRYAAFLSGVTPLQTPRSFPVAAIVTGRPEKYRRECEAWLARHRVRYSKLVMWPGDAAARWVDDACTRWKASMVRDLAVVRLFVESDPRQAQRIADLSGKRVICPALGRTLLPAPRPTISLLLPTISRPSLAGALRSLQTQAWEPGDEVILIGDGRQPEARRMWESAGLPGRYVEVPGPSGDWGHTPRNLIMGEARGDYLMALDDDDELSPNAIATIRAALRLAPGRPHLFRMRLHHHGGRIVWHDREIQLGNVGTSMFVTPSGRVGRYRPWYGGDSDFIRETCSYYPDPPVWREEVICEICPSSALAGQK